MNEIRIRATGAIVTEEQFRAAASVVYPQVLSKQMLNETGADPVLVGAQPMPGPYEYVVRDGAEKNALGDWVQKWKIVSWSQEQIDSTIESECNAVWVSIQEERTRRKFAGVQANGLWFHSDNDSRVQWLGLARKADLVIASGLSGETQLTVNGKPLVWKRLGGGFAQVTANLAIAVVEAIELLDAQAFEAAEVHNMKMRASASPRGYDFSQGWPTMKEELSKEIS
jgi:hypothetical protein